MSLAVTDLGCERGGRRVFEHLNFKAAAGEYIELRGPNGSGKSSLLRLLAGFDQPSHGRISITGDIHYVGHLDAIKLALTVRENLVFWRDYFAAGDITNALAAFSLTPLADDPASYLSQGQKRRLALSRLALTNHPIWLLDEPTVGLDTNSLNAFAELSAKHLANTGVIIAATHAATGFTPTQLIDLDTKT